MNINIPGLPEWPVFNGGHNAAMNHAPDERHNLQSSSLMGELMPEATGRANTVGAAEAALFHQIISTSFTPQEVAELMAIRHDAGIVSPLDQAPPVMPAGNQLVPVAMPEAVTAEAAGGLIDPDSDEDRPLVQAMWDGRPAELEAVEVFQPPVQAGPMLSTEPVPGAVPVYDVKQEAGMANPQVEQTVTYWNDVTAMPEMAPVPAEAAATAANGDHDQAARVAAAQERVRSQYGLAA